MPKTRTLLALVLLPLLVFLVACDGGDDDGDNGNSDQPTASDASSAGSGSTSSGGGTGGGGGSTDAATILGNCPELLSMFGAFTAGAFANPSSGNAGDDLETVADIFQNAANNAPSEIQADMQVLADAFTSYNNTLQDLGIDFSNPASFAALDAGQLAQFQAALESFDTPELEQASDNLDAWFTENCE